MQRTNQLQKAVNSEISQSQCRLEIPPSSDLKLGVVNTQICAKNTATYADTCQGSRFMIIELKNINSFLFIR